MSNNIVFVNPPLTGEKRYGALAGGGVYMPPLGLCYLASVVRKCGFKSHIVDCEALGLNVEEAVKYILSYRANYVGITASTVSIYNAANLAKVIKQKCPDLVIIIGGPHISAVPEETMERFIQFDIGVIGEGEITITELLKALNQNEELSQIRGLIIRENGGLRITEDRPFINNLDTLPFPSWDLLPDLTRYYRPSTFGFKRLPVTSLITSRGCPGRCAFCNQGPFGKKYREHSAEYVTEMIKYLYFQYKIRDFMIYDGTFGVNKNRLIKLCEMLIKEKLDLVWSSNGRIDMMSPQILRLMKQSGCWGIAYGIESGSQEILDFLQKDINLEMITKTIEWTKAAGIVTKGYIMIGTLIETRETIQKTIDFILRSKLDLLTVNHFTPFPGTKDYQRAFQYGSFNNDWNLLNEHNLVFIPKNLTASEIEDSIRIITRRFYLRPKIIFNYLKIHRNTRNFFLMVNGLISFLKFIIKKPAKIKFIFKIPRGRIYFSPKIIRKAISIILSRRWLEGEFISEFEDRFARYIGTGYAIAVSSGKIALYLSLKVLGVNKGDEIIISSYTVPEVIAVIVYCGAKPVFMDINPETYNMDFHLIEEKISSKTKFLLLTHIYGQPCDIEPILEVARKYNLKIIEDCAQACGAEYKGKRVGVFGDLAYFSFGLMKNLNTLGGGAITTNNGKLVNRIRKEISIFNYPKGSELIKRLIFVSFASFLTRPLAFTIFVFPIVRILNLVNDNLLYNLLKGRKELNLNQTTLSEKYKVKFTNLQAAIGIRQLEELEKNNSLRIVNAEILTNMLKEFGLKIPYTLPCVKNIYLNYVVQVKDKKRIIKGLLKRGIDVTEGYIKSCSNLKEFQEFKSDCPISDALSKDNLYLPIQPPLKERHMLHIAKSLKELL